MRSLLLKPFLGDLAGGPMGPGVGRVHQPTGGLGVQVLQVTEGAAVEEAAPEVGNSPFHSAFGLGPVGGRQRV